MFVRVQLRPEDWQVTLPLLLQAETEYSAAPMLADQDTTAALLMQSGATVMLVGTHGTAKRAWMKIKSSTF